ncbi:MULTISPECIES: murein L,D-transpeptidase family protein [unclassified Roseitalea]|uniref:murein L,D-transpeptidase family protein n=1 Tax=unclassified Roseitalea TaxID=2639107 RepID=UPI0032080E70
MRMRSALSALALSAAIALAGCQASDIFDLAAEEPLPRDVVATMDSMGMTKASPIMMRIFKEEAVLEVFKQKPNGRYALVKSYDICEFSGEKGPKFAEGDRQSPEGFYFVHRGLLNPNSDYHLSFNLGFPNAYDRAHGRTGSNLMVHGDCSSRGCYAMTDDYVTEIYAFARDALRGGQQDAFQVQAFPFRMTAENMAKHRHSPHFEYWTMLKSGYDQFELTKVPPKVDVCERRYVFNRKIEGEGAFDPVAQCPPTSMPRSLELAYNALRRDEAVAFEAIVARKEGRSPRPFAELAAMAAPFATPAMPPMTSVEAVSSISGDASADALSLAPVPVARPPLLGQ